jgi:AraC-like DNA-binding protein
MTGQQSLLAFLFAVCLIQGAFLGPVVANLDRGNRRATLILAALLLCFLPAIGEEFIEVSGLTTRLPHTIGSSITVDFLIAPLLLFYARSLTEPDARYRRRDLIHFAPFALAVLALLPWYAQSGAAKLRSLDGGVPAAMQVVVILKIIVAVAYVTLVIRHLHRFVKRPGNPNARDPNVLWFLRAMVALACVAAGSVVIGLLPRAGVAIPIDSDALGTLFMGGSIYLISFLLIRHPFAPVRVAPASEPGAVRAVRVKYESSPLDQAQKRHYLDRLTRHMEAEKPFRDMQLSLEKLASAIDIRPGYLSQVLNEQVGVNFYEFVNTYRVGEVQMRIAAGEHASRTLLSLAYESGFNSKASFNRAFKRVTGLTPSEYARRQLSGDAPS